MARTFELTTPLGPDVLLFHRMRAREELSRIGEFEIDVLSKRGDVSLDGILGKKVTIKVELPKDKIRYFNGFVTRFAQVGMHGRYHLYRATVRPWLWFLTRTADCRIFQDMSAPDIVKKVFQDHSIADFDMKTTLNYPKREYCVQYRETDYNFVSRLMEEEGIYFFFKHADGRHTLVLADSYSAHQPFEGYAQIPFIQVERTSRIEQEYIHEWNFAREVQPGRYVIDYFDFKKPSVDLEVRTSQKRSHDHAENEMYDYPGNFLTTDEGNQIVRTRLDELQARFELANGSTNARGVCVGSLFKLTGQPRSDQNREYLVLAAEHEMEYSEYEAMESAGTNYACRFRVLESKQSFRPRRLTPKPVVQGPQTAVVVGPSGDEIYTDKYGRVKVQFHWDRYGKKDENSSCWIRVSHPWAGKSWGSVSIPRIDQEVIVDFLEGDPDQPIITGRVYNADQMPPYGLPAGGVVSGLKTNTHKGKGYNEMSMDDTAGKEKITIHAQYDMGTTVLHDQTNTVNGKMTEVIDKDTSITIKTGKYEHNVKTATAAYYVKGAVTQKFENIWESKVTGKVSIKSNADIHIDSDTKITLVTGSSKLVMESTGVISLTGTKISVIGNDEVKVSSAKTEVSGGTEAKFGTGNQNITTNPAKTAISGAAINSSAVGMHEITGAVVKIN